MDKDDLKKIKIFFTVLLTITIWICIYAGIDCIFAATIQPWKHMLLWFVLGLYNGLLLVLILGLKSIEINKE